MSADILKNLINYSPREKTWFQAKTNICDMKKLSPNVHKHDEYMRGGTVTGFILTSAVHLSTVS